MSDVATVDSNVAVYALTGLAQAPRANHALRSSNFLSTQVLNEVANVARKKLRFDWAETRELIEKLDDAVPTVIPILPEHSREALRIAERYMLSFYDALMLSVALSGGARTIYSEDMQHDLLIDGALRIVDPFR